MSSPGFFLGDQDPNEQAKAKMMADILQGKQAQGQQSPFAPIGNAMIQKAIQNRANQTAQNNAFHAPVPGVNGAMLSTQTPNLPVGGMNGLRGLFSFGGGQ